MNFVFQLIKKKQAKKTSTLANAVFFFVFVMTFTWVLSEVEPDESHEGKVRNILTSEQKNHLELIFRLINTSFIVRIAKKKNVLKLHIKKRNRRKKEE